MQFFKGDAQEQKFYNSGHPTLNSVQFQRDTMFDEVYTCFLLGDLLWETGRSPLANAIKQEIFRVNFPDIYDSFTSAGTFESYISIFKKIFGTDVDVQFTIPGNGQLQIAIHATGVEESNLSMREIVDNVYVLSDLKTQDGVDQIMVQTVKGFESQYELDQMLFEMVPGGVYTEITLTLGE